MAIDPMEAIREAGAAARAGMGLENDQESVEIDSPEEDTFIESEPEEETTVETPEVEPEAPQAQDRSVFRQLNEIRSQKRQAEQQNAQLLELVGASTMEEAQTKLSELRASQPLSPEFLDAAKELGIEDPETLKKVSDLIVGQVKKEFAPIQEQISRQATTVQEVQEQRELQESLEQFEGEWKEVLPVIEGEYKPTATQLQEAKDYLIEKSHSEEYFDKELDYVLYKEQENLEGILGARKRKTMLSARGVPQASKPEGMLVKPDGSHESFIKAAKRMKDIAGRSQFDSEEEARI